MYSIENIVVDTLSWRLDYKKGSKPSLAIILIGKGQSLVFQTPQMETITLIDNLNLT